MLESDVSFRVLDLNLLRVLDAMMTEGSVAGAASRLSITPSAVSHSLGRLRSLFNDPLFIRSSSGMRATPRASEIGGKVREGLHYLESALTPAAFLAAESQRTFTVACSAYVSAVLLPEVIARMRQRAPRAGVAVASWGPGVLDRFEAGQIDVLLGDFTRVPEGYVRQTLFEDGRVWLMGRDYILEPGQADRRTQLETMTLDLPNRSVLENGFVRRATLDECCGIVGNPVDRAMGDPMLESLPYSMVAPLLVKQADLAAFLRLDVIEPARDELVGDEPVADAADAEIRIAAIRHPDYGRRAPVAWFCDLLAEAAAMLAVGDARAPRGDGSPWKENSRGSSRTLSPAEDEGPS
jgi:DNA-binding transcriptional LysR family regulator